MRGTPGTKNQSGHVKNGPLAIVSRYGSHLYHDTFAEVLGSGVVGTLSTKAALCRSAMECAQTQERLHAEHQQYLRTLSTIARAL